MQTVMEAIFGLVGVLVGGGITFGIEWWRERRRFKGEARVAARLALSELTDAAVAFRTVSDAGGQEMPEWVREMADFPFWKEHRAVLALTLDSADWGKVEAAFLAAEGRIQHQYQAWEKPVTEGLKALSAPAGLKQPPTLPRSP